ncbi:unnamed protein product [Amoebophrya sp. A120]|nr:unnamed protein product [Amoebophrya sp. A120]|eukprot:GSA120T00020842001.1
MSYFFPPPPVPPYAAAAAMAAAAHEQHQQSILASTHFWNKSKDSSTGATISSETLTSGSSSQFHSALKGNPFNFPYNKNSNPLSPWTTTASPHKGKGKQKSFPGSGKKSSKEASCNIVEHPFDKNNFGSSSYNNFDFPPPPFGGTLSSSAGAARQELQQHQSYNQYNHERSLQFVNSTQQLSSFDSVRSSGRSSKRSAGAAPSEVELDNKGLLHGRNYPGTNKRKNKIKNKEKRTGKINKTSSIFPTLESTFLGPHGGKQQEQFGGGKGNSKGSHSTANPLLPGNIINIDASINTSSTYNFDGCAQHSAAAAAALQHSTASRPGGHLQPAHTSSIVAAGVQLPDRSSVTNVNPYQNIAISGTRPATTSALVQDISGGPPGHLEGDFAAGASQQDHNIFTTDTEYNIENCGNNINDITTPLHNSDDENQNLEELYQDEQELHRSTSSSHEGVEVDHKEDDVVVIEETSNNLCEDEEEDYEYHHHHHQEEEELKILNYSANNIKIENNTSATRRRTTAGTSASQLRADDQDTIFNYDQEVEEHQSGEENAPILGENLIPQFRDRISSSSSVEEKTIVFPSPFSPALPPEALWNHLDTRMADPTDHFPARAFRCVIEFFEKVWDADKEKEGECEFSVAVDMINKYILTECVDLPSEWQLQIEKVLTLLLLSLDVLDTFLFERMDEQERGPPELTPVRLAMLRFAAFWVAAEEKGDGQAHIRAAQTICKIAALFFDEDVDFVKTVTARFQPGAFAEFQRRHEMQNLPPLLPPLSTNAPANNTPGGQQGGQHQPPTPAGAQTMAHAQQQLQQVGAAAVSMQLQQQQQQQNMDKDRSPVTPGTTTNVAAGNMIVPPGMTPGGTMNSKGGLPGNAGAKFLMPMQPGMPMPPQVVGGFTPTGPQSGKNLLHFPGQQHPPGVGAPGGPPGGFPQYGQLPPPYGTPNAGTGPPGFPHPGTPGGFPGNPGGPTPPGGLPPQLQVQPPPGTKGPALKPGAMPPMFPPGLVPPPGVPMPANYSPFKGNHLQLMQLQSPRGAGTMPPVSGPGGPQQPQLPPGVLVQQPPPGGPGGPPQLLPIGAAGVALDPAAAQQMATTTSSPNAGGAPAASAAPDSLPLPVTENNEDEMDVDDDDKMGVDSIIANKKSSSKRRSSKRSSKRDRSKSSSSSELSDEASGAARKKNIKQRRGSSSSASKNNSSDNNEEENVENEDKKSGKKSTNIETRSRRRRSKEKKTTRKSKSSKRSKSKNTSRSGSNKSKSSNRSKSSKSNSSKSARDRSKSSSRSSRSRRSSSRGSSKSSRSKSKNSDRSSDSDEESSEVQGPLLETPLELKQMASTLHSGTSADGLQSAGQGAGDRNNTTDHPLDENLSKSLQKAKNKQKQKKDMLTGIKQLNVSNTLSDLRDRRAEEQVRIVKTYASEGCQTEQAPDLYDRKNLVKIMTARADRFVSSRTKEEIDADEEKGVSHCPDIMPDFSFDQASSQPEVTNKASGLSTIMEE